MLCLCLTLLFGVCLNVCLTDGEITSIGGKHDIDTTHGSRDSEEERHDLELPNNYDTASKVTASLASAHEDTVEDKNVDVDINGHQNSKNYDEDDVEQYNGNIIDRSSKRDKRSPWWWFSVPESKYCIESYTTSRYTWTGNWWRSRKVKRYYTSTRRVCCPGYGGTFCHLPICGGGTRQETSCNRNEGMVIHKNGNIFERSGGFCSKPKVCIACNTGYYPDTSVGYCRACPTITNCNIPSCTNRHDTECLWCVGELKDVSEGWNVFTGEPHRDKCRRACSWRNGYRCFPGNCTDSLFSNCQCAKGFGGTNCATANADALPLILTQELILKDDNHPLLIVPDPNAPNDKVWTNIVQWSTVTFNTSANYELVDVEIPSYINDSLTHPTIGIDTIITKAVLYRNQTFSEWKTTKICDYIDNCKHSDTRNLETMPWNQILQGGFPTPFEHNDIIKFTVVSKNGGIVPYIDRELKNKYPSSHSWEKSYSIKGIEDENTLELEFDLFAPGHCFEEKYRCDKDALVTPDFVAMAQFTVSWDGWTDTDSGIKEYHLDVYRLKVLDPTADSPQLAPEPQRSFNTIVSHTETSETISLTEAGAYALEIITYDRAGNHKLARRIFLFDDASIVELQGARPIVVTAVKDTGYMWINKMKPFIELTWPGRFINKRHSTLGWLSAVKDNPSVPRDLDDLKDVSKRNVERFHNILGIVRVDVAYTVDVGGNVPAVVNSFTTIPKHYFDDQKIDIYEDFDDGKKLTFTIRGYDVMDKYADDTVSVKIDLSPPVIQNLWLTKGDIVNISVHSVLELNQLTIEWEVYDIHSGLHEISWRLFDNFTNDVVDHGKSPLAPQGDVMTQEECKSTYGGYARGSDCYCTPFDGCFHRHYQIKPTIDTSGEFGLHPDRADGVHEREYFVEVNATNKAFLTTLVYLKITIDTSPPHDGTVHDGERGQLEIDFQQSLYLTSHWDGFFDKESGVWFYQYAYGKACLQASDLDIHSKDNNKGTKTYSTSASYTAPGPGTYFLTVVAYNHALDHSSPVCSDGVTVDLVKADVSEVVVAGAVTRQGLLKDENNEVWFLYNNRVIAYVDEPTQDCIDKALLVSNVDVSLFPQRRLANGTKRSVNSQFVCSLHYDMHGNILAFVTSDTHLDISWNVSHSLSGVYNYEVGLASQRSIVADKSAFISTKQHQHIRLFHPSIMDGDEFYVVIKSVTKAAITDFKVVGPFAVDVTKPAFQGTIAVTFERGDKHNFLVARWLHDTFHDHGDPHQLHLEVAVGSFKCGKNILSFTKLTNGASCANPPLTCTAIDIELLPWTLHGHQSYYVTIKATNTAGLFITACSEEYIHDVDLATIGVVYDIDDGTELKFVDIDDIDYQTSTSRLSLRWSGFKHPHLEIKFRVCVMNEQEDTTIICEAATDDNKHTFSGLHLVPYQTYFQSVIAETAVGNVSARSDGVTVVVDSDELHGIYVFDGALCNGTSDEDLILEHSHHTEDKRLNCTTDVEYQSATNELAAYWTIPDDVKYYLKNVYVAVEERAPVVDYWTLFREYEHIKAALHVKSSELFLKAGRSYRTSIRYCAENHCFKPLVSNGVTIIPNPPVALDLKIQYNETERKISGAFEAFHDSDIEDLDEARDVMDHYEWAFINNHDNARLLTKWKRMEIKTETAQITFEINLESQISFIKCWSLAVRGYTKAGLSSTTSREIRNCSDINQVRPSVAIDAFGVKDIASGDIHKGLPISIDENAIWPKDDVDYTPYHNILSAVWPTLRHKRYSWAILEIQKEDPTIFYKSSNELQLRDPCSHPDAIKCGITDLAYVNVIFGENELHHGKRYITCLHGNATSLHHERWTQELDDVSTCSDGVTVDLTPPTPGYVWIGHRIGNLYLTTTSDLAVNWNSFLDVEEEGYSVHTSGITTYQVALGTARGGQDIITFRDVGLTNHFMFHGLRLQSGHTYFATVKAFDFTGQSSEGFSSAVKIDTTPPVMTEHRIKLQSRHITDTAYVSACWTGVFLDNESGISHYSWSIGTHPGYADVIAFVDTTMDCGQTSSNDNLDLYEGHSYFISVKAYNNAGLYTIATSWAFTVDSSPPAAGHVYDGPRAEDDKYHDVDYVTSTSTLEAHWENFNDAHSTVKEYYIRVGSCQECEDVLVRQPIGVRNDISLSMLSLAEGIKYYTTVTACNTADLCSSATSDGVLVDTSPPIHGRVLDGATAIDIQYQASRIYVGCTWYGFVDPQSGISHYVWRVGTSKGADDVVKATDVHMSQKAFIYDLSTESNMPLPVGVRIYSTIRAYNHAGMYVESTSNGFAVDDTPPIKVKELSLSPLGTFDFSTSILRSVMRLDWQIEDSESYIDSQYLSVSSHIGGDFNLSSIKVDGVVRDYTLTGLTLHDGSYYDVRILSCNGAKLCTESNLNGLLFDSSAPSNGMFAINTDHAAALNRQPEGWMEWNSIRMDLAWLGFTDVHSGIVSYTVNVGSSYMANDLNEIENTSTVLPHKDDAMESEEGFVQLHSIRTQLLSQHKSVFVSMWATNGVGLRSPIVHAEFDLVHGGMLALVRRCTSKTCEGHCTCGPHGELCSKTESNCRDVSAANNNSIIEVKTYLDLTFPDDYLELKHSPVNSFLAAKWSIVKSQGLRPLWYEWSVGDAIYDTPKGVFDDRVWHDAGKNTSWVFVHKRDKAFTERDHYSFFVRAWYDENTFAVFKSASVLIYSTPPIAVSVRGKKVKELLRGGKADIDYITKDMQVRADWTGRFNTDGSLFKYHVYLSTRPGGNDVHIVGLDLPPSTTSYNITGLPLAEDTMYYTVVQAYNSAGLHITEYSDGFMLDLYPPTTGIVHDGEAFKDILAINSTCKIPSFWYGFSDLHSGIKTYEQCVSTKRGQCDVKAMSAIGVTTKYNYIAATPFESGTSLMTEVRAVDFVGQTSETVVSDGIVIDTSPPVRATEEEYGPNVVDNHSFEMFAESYNITNNTMIDCDMKPPVRWETSDNSCMRIVTFQAQESIPDGERCLLLQGRISQNISLPQHGRYRLKFSISTLPNQNLLQSANEGFVNINGERHVFLIYEKISGSTDNVLKYAWQTYFFFFSLDALNITLEFGTVNDHTAVAVDNIVLQPCVLNIDEISEDSGHVKVHTSFVHDWSSIHADWSFNDPESGILEYLWAIGTVEGGTQLQDFTSVGRRTFAYTYTLHLVHDTVVYVTVVAVNGAGLRTVSYSNPIIIDITPPMFSFVNDGLEYGKDFDFQRHSSTISANWGVADQESGVEECRWAIGELPGDTTIQNFEKVQEGTHNCTAVLLGAALAGKFVFITVICTNGAGLTNTGFSDGIRILETAPSLDDVLLEVLTTSQTQYPAHGAYHSNSSEVRFRWTGFNQDEGIDSYLVALNGNDVHVEELVVGTTVGFTYASFTSLQLPDGEYTVSVTAINQIQMFSQKKTAMLQLLTQNPTLSGSSIQTSWNKYSGSISASWETVFHSEHPLYFEVTVTISEGGDGDLVQWQETTNTDIVVKMNTDDIPETGFNVLVSVRAISYCGLFESTQTDIFINV